jgi:hypothetical protein
MFLGDLWSLAAARPGKPAKAKLASRVSLSASKIFAFLDVIPAIAF